LVATALAACGALYVLLAVSQRRALLRRLSPRGADEVSHLARRVEDFEELARSAKTRPLGMGVREILDRVGRASSRREARTEVDEYLSELDAGLAAASASLMPHARVSLLTGTLAAIVGLIGGASDVARALPEAVAALGVGLAGAVVAWEAGRWVTSRASRFRADYDQVVGALTRWL
jgi:hypothetical protein